MGVPRAHATRGHTRRRRSHQALSERHLSNCQQCKKPIISHRMCRYCGYYKGQEVVNIIGKELKRKEKKQKANA